MDWDRADVASPRTVPISARCMLTAPEPDEPLIGFLCFLYSREKNAFIARQGTYDLLYLDVKPPGRLHPTHPPPPAAAKYRRDDHEEMPPPLHASQRQRLQVIRREGSARPVHPLKVTRC